MEDDKKTVAEQKIEMAQKEMGDKIKNTTASSLAQRRPLSTEQLNAIISPKKVAPEKFRVPPVQGYPLEDNGDTGIGYDASRDNALSPVTQYTSGGRITNNPADVYIGGGAPRNTGVYAQMPTYDGERNTFYLKQKFAPVKPYKFTLANGNVVELDTANKNKAAYLAIGMTEPGLEIDWHGYNRLLETPHEGPVHGFMRGLTNTWPQMIMSTLGYAGTTLIDIYEGIDKLLGDEDSAKIWSNLRQTAFNTIDDLQYDLTWHFGPKGVGDRDANKMGNIFGSLVATIPLAFAHNMAGLGIVNAFEAAEGGYEVRRAMYDQGVSTLNSFFRAAGTGGGVWLLGQVPEFWGVAMRTWGVPAKSLTRLARMNPEAFNKLLRRKKSIIALAEGVSEPSQDFLVNAVTGEDNDWEAALATFFFSAILARATMAFDKTNSAAAHLERASLFKNFVKDHMDSFQKIVEMSGGSVSLENIDAIIDAVFDPKADNDVLNLIKEGFVANFDKITDEDKAKLQDFLQKFDSEVNLSNEFAMLDKQVDEMLDRSEAVDLELGRPALTTAQRDLVKLMIRGVAAHQLVNFQILPSQMQIPSHIFGGYSDAARAENAEGSQYQNTLTVNNALRESSLPVGRVGSADVTGSANQRASASVKNEFASAGVSSAQSGGFANLPHEFWHWIETQTGLTDVGQFVTAMQQLAEKIVPGITAGKSGVELSEAYAYALGYAGEKAKGVLGLTGPVADYIDFMHNMLNAKNVAQGVSDNLKGYMASFRAVLQANKGLLKDILNGYAPSELKGAINDFIKTGSTGPLKFEDLRALNAVLSSVSDAEARDNLSQIFDSPRDAYSFMRRYAEEYDRLLAKDREGAAAKAEEYRRIANEMVGVGKEITPSTSREDTFEQKANEIVAEETPAETPEEAPAEAPANEEAKPEEKPAEEGKKPEIKSRMHTEGPRAGTPYDVDELVKGNYDEEPDVVVGYLENAAQWAKNENIGKETLAGKTVKLSSINGELQVKLEPSLGNTRADHRAAYVILAKNKLKQMNEKGLLTEEHKRRAKNTEMFAVRSKLKDQSTNVLNFLATKVATKVATPDETALYTAMAEFDKALSDLYVDFGPYTPVETAIAAKTAAEDFAYQLQDLSKSKDSSVRRIIRGGPSLGGEEYLRGMLPEQVDERLSFGVFPSYEGGYFHYEMKEPNRSMIDAVADYIYSLDKFIEDKTFEEEKQVFGKEEPLSRNERKAFNILEDTNATEGQKRAARAYLGAVGASKTDPMNKFFGVAYDTPDISENFIDTSVLSTARRIKNRPGATDAEIAGAENVLRAGEVMSPYTNPIRGYLKRDIINTPTPLEELGISMEEAEEQIRAAGLEPYDFLNGKLADEAREKLSPDYIRKNLNDPNPDVYMKTRRSMLARLLKDIPSIGDSKNRAERLRILHAISSAKAAVDQLFQDVINSEDSYNYNPTGPNEASALLSAEDFKQSDRFQAKLAEHQAMGYTEAVDASNLDVSDEIAFPYGNNIFRGVISFKGKMPSGATSYIILEDVDLGVWRAKDISSMKVPPRQLKISEADLRNVGFLRKPIEVANFNKYADLLSLFDDICATHENWSNWTRIAQASVAEAQEDMALRSGRKDITEIESDESADYDEDNPENEYYAVRSNTTDVPEVDPGAYVLMDNNMTDEDWSALLGGTEEELIRRLESLQGGENAKLALWEMRQAKVEQVKPKFASYGGALRETLKNMRDGIANRKWSKWTKVLLLGGWQTGLDRKLRMIFGDKVGKSFNFVVASSRAQELSEGMRHAFDKAVTDNVFNGSRIEYERWVNKLPTETYDAQLSNGTTQKVTKDEIISMGIAKRAVEKNLIDTYNYTNPEDRMRGFYKNFDELLSHMTEQDWKFVDTALEALASARGQDGVLPAYWAPSTLAKDYGRNGWGARLTSTPDNSINVVNSMEPLAATGAYQSVLSIIGSTALKQSGLPKQLKALRDILVFEDIDMSYFKQLSPDEEALYNDIKAQAAQLKSDLEAAIGPTMFKWLIDNIDVDLKFNPLVKDMTKNPVMGAFQKATRNVASSLLMLNLKQGYVNLGNYDLFLGLSNSGMLRFYTSDRVNAWMHIRDAWKLAMEIPEFKRRLEQSGLSEQMRRVADMNEESFFKDIQQALYRSGKGRAGDIVGAINTLGKISAKYGLATNVVPDLVGIALGTYAVWNDVLARNNGNVQAAQDEIVDHILNRVSSSNYMTRSAATKLMHRAGLEALVAFKNDQLQKVGSICEAALRLINDSDPDVRAKAWKDIEAAAWSTLRYIAVQAGWIVAMAQLLTGHDLDDEEKKYLYEATVRETLSQIGDTTQVGSFIVPIFTGIYEGRDMGSTLLPIGGIQRATVAARKGNVFKAIAEGGAFIGATPVAPATVRLLDALYRVSVGDEKEQAVGRLMLLGRSEPTAQKMMGYSRSQKTGKLRNKKSKKESD